VSGEVVHGDGRGFRLGFPTANLDVWEERALPKAGVYACLTMVDGESWKSVANVGFRPTFTSGRQSKATPVIQRIVNNQSLSLVVEVHLLDFQRDLYCKQISLSFIARLRDEQRFFKVQDLVHQIERDINQARKIL
jgi:riboflavin kinase/FMN adenylyltransferase